MISDTPTGFLARKFLIAGLVSGLLSGGHAIAGGPNPSGVSLDEGEELFARTWLPNDPRSPNGDGLGPVYNATSCVACHNLGGPGGAGTTDKNAILLSVPLDEPKRPPVDVKGVIGWLHPGFLEARSVVLHRFGVDPRYSEWLRRLADDQMSPDEVVPFRDGPSKGDEATLNPDDARNSGREGKFAGDRLASRLQRRFLRVKVPSPKGTLELTLGQRNAPALFGVGRIDAVPESALLAVMSSQPAWVRGRIPRTAGGKVGRFGWKGQLSDLDEFVLSACASELGLEVPGHHQARSPVGSRRDEDSRGLDLTLPECEALVAYIRALPSPAKSAPHKGQSFASVKRGRALFASVGCGDCHATNIGKISGIYSDMQLHDMGLDLSSAGSSYGGAGPEKPGSATSVEWRTPPLWGFHDSGPYLHDGRAATLEEAVRLHKGQASYSNGGFFALPAPGRADIEAFLNTLVAPSPRPTLGVKRAEEAEAREVLQRREVAAARKIASALSTSQALEKMGKLAAALEGYRRVVGLDPESPEAEIATRRIAAIQGPAELRSKE